MKTSYYPIFLYLIFILSSCAQVVPPTGGDKDILPPKMVSAIPPQESIGFKSDEIIIEFDEYIQFRNLNEQLLISPPMEAEPNIEIRGKTLLIELDENLKSNTTYVMNFGNSIVDLNEGNPYGNFTYVFSTGSSIDSLELMGQVLDAYSLKADKNMLVLLFRDYYDSIPFKELPNYVSRTDEEGKFQFSNLSKGKYHVMALDDKNKNFKYDPVAEKIAFEKKAIHLDGNFKDSLQLFLFAEKNPITYVLESKLEGAALRLVFNNPLDSFKLDPLNGEKLPAHLIEQHFVKDTVVVWFRNIGNGLSFSSILKDGNKIIDTISVKIPPLKNDSTVGLAEKTTKTQNFFQPFQIKFNSPIASIQKEKIHLYLGDSIPVAYKLKHKKGSRRIDIVNEWKEDSIYSVLLLPKAVKDVNGRINDSIVSEFTINSSDQFSSLQVKVETETSEPMIMQLLNEEGKILREEKAKGNIFEFDYLASGNYKLKLIFDSNKNGKWDTGHYLLKQFPEKAVLFDGKITIRPKWEQELIWKIK